MAAITAVTMKVHRSTATAHDNANVQELHLTAIPVASRIPPNFTQECNCKRRETQQDLNQFSTRAMGD